MSGGGFRQQRAGRPEQLFKRLPKRDIDALLAAGLVSVETAANPGHGTQKVVRAVTSRVDLHVLID